MTTESATLHEVGSATDLGNVIRDTRLRLGLSQAELARDAKVGRQWLVGLELGDKSSAPFDMVLRVLRVLDVSIMVKPRPAYVNARSNVPVITATEILSRYTKV